MKTKKKPLKLKSRQKYFWVAVDKRGWVIPALGFHWLKAGMQWDIAGSIWCDEAKPRKVIITEAK